MRTRFTEVTHSALLTTDGWLGKVTDFLVEDNSWIIRYVVVSTDSSLPLFDSRRVLIAPAVIKGYDTATDSIATTLTSQRVIGSPRLDSDQPISRDYEQSLVDYYGWPIYWFGRAVQMKPQTLTSLADNDATDAVIESGPNLRSAVEICGYEIKSQNGPAGVLRDLVVNLDAWTIDFAIAESQAWIRHESATFSTKWISRVDWKSQQIAVDLSKAGVEKDQREQPAIASLRLASKRFGTI